MSETPDYLYRLLRAGGFGSGETNALLNLINYQPETDNFFICPDPYETKYKFLSEKEKLQTSSI